MMPITKSTMVYPISFFTCMAVVIFIIALLIK